MSCPAGPAPAAEGRALFFKRQPGRMAWCAPDWCWEPAGSRASPTMPPAPPRPTRTRWILTADVTWARPPDRSWPPCPPRHPGERPVDDRPRRRPRLHAPRHRARPPRPPRPPTDPPGQPRRARPAPVADAQPARRLGPPAPAGRPYRRRRQRDPDGTLDMVEHASAPSTRSWARAGLTRRRGSAHVRQTRPASHRARP